MFIVVKYLKRYKKEVYKTLAVCLLVAGLSTLIPTIYGKLVDLVLKGDMGKGDMLSVFTHTAAGRELAVLLVLWLFITIGINFFTSYLSRKKGDISVQCEGDLVISANAYLLELPLSFHKDKKIGELFEKIARAGFNVRNIISQIVFTALPDFLTVVIVLLIISIFISAKLVMVVFAVIILYALVILAKTKTIVIAEEKNSKAYEDAYGDMYDSVINARAVKSFTAESEERKKYLSGYRSIWREEFAINKIGGNLQFIESSIMGIGSIFIFGISFFLLMQKEITVGQMITLIGYIGLVYKPLINLSDNYILIKKGMVSIERVEALMREKREAYEGGTTPKIVGGMKFENVDFAYNGDQETLKNVSFSAQPGEVIALVGESGAGKTTLTDLIPRFIEPSRGRILLDGCDLREINLSYLRKEIAIVPQEILLFNSTVENNIRFGKPEAMTEEIEQAARTANAYEFISKFADGYQQMVGERGIKLSTGQKQRIAFARAILKNSKFLILDEATSALDSKTEKLIQDALKKLIKGRTTFIIAHRLSTIRHADKILVVKDGEIIEQGKHEELIAKNGYYKELHDLQNF